LTASSHSGSLPIPGHFSRRGNVDERITSSALQRLRMYTVASAISFALGALSLLVAGIGVRDGYFPFRPRRSGAALDGDRHSLRRSDEPVRFWVVAGGLFAVGLVSVGSGAWVAALLYSGKL
jgi:hypothetical protein